MLEKPATIKTHLRDMIVLPEMVGSVVGIYSGKTFNQVRLALLLFLRNGTNMLAFHNSFRFARFHYRN